MEVDSHFFFYATGFGTEQFAEAVRAGLRKPKNWDYGFIA